MTLAAWSAVKLRPIASTKSPSGSVHDISMCPLYFGIRVHTHKVKVDAVIHQIVLSRLHTAWCTKVHPIRFASLLDLLVFARQANKIRMKLFQVLLEHWGGVTRRITRNHKWEEDFAALLGDFVVHQGHLVELVGADIGAVGESEIDLRSDLSASIRLYKIFGRGSTYQ
jgi:hypothetical protein